MIYLDSAAMHPVLPCALEAYRTAPFGNPSSEHAVGTAARDALEAAREKIAAIMCCDPDQVFFFSTATEAAATALKSCALNGIHVSASPFEHHAISENINDEHRPLVPLQAQEAFCQMHSNNEVGNILPLPSDALYNGDLFICDATSAVGHVPIRFSIMDVLIADVIKFGGVPGAAFMIANDRFPLSPLINGGGQERGMRSGTENVPAICAMAAALEWQTEHMEENMVKLSKLSKVFETILSEIDGVRWNTPLGGNILPHIRNISFDGVDAKALTLLLSEDGVMVSPGAACSNGLNEPSHVIMAMFNDEERARSAIRISVSHENSEIECEIAANIIKECVSHLRSIA